jgi:hypothetical protein
MTQIETASELTCLYGEPTVLAKKNLSTRMLARSSSVRPFLSCLPPTPTTGRIHDREAIHRVSWQSRSRARFLCRKLAKLMPLPTLQPA